MRNAIRSLVPLITALALMLPGCNQNPTQFESVEPRQEKGERKEQLPETVSISPTAMREAAIKTWIVAPVQAGNTITLNGSAGYDENHLLVLAPAVSGRVAQLVDLGKAVRKGQPVAWIESVELGRARQEYVRAITDFEIAQKTYERSKRLAAEKAISAGEFQQREGDYLTKRAAVTAAEAALRQAGDDPTEARQQGAAALPRVALRAPFDGRVVDRKVNPGAMVEALHPIITVADLSSVWCFFQVYDKDLGAIRMGLPIEVSSDAFPGERLVGKIDFIGSDVDVTTRTVRVRATVRNREQKLRAGMFVRGRIEASESPAAAAMVAVPKSALQTLEGRPTVFVRVAPTKFARRFVETGRTFDEYVQILSGIRPGDEVVVDGSFVLKSEFSKAALAEEE